MSAYTHLEKIFRRYSALSGAGSILHWDNAAMLPQNAGEPRGEQLAALAEVAHETITQPQLADLLEAAAGEKLSDWQQANLREMKRSWRHANALPEALVTELTTACHESEGYWRQARKENDFKSFAPYLERVLKLVRETADAKSAAMGMSPYDCLLDQYDPGTRAEEVDHIFGDLSEFLPGFIARATDHQARRAAPLPIRGTFPARQQKALGARMMEKLGFDFTRGRLDESAHPFCGGVPGDVRLTTRYDESDFMQGFFGVMHETGHALYEMNLPCEWRGQPVGEARGMATHESQSLLVEMQLCLGSDFLHYAAPMIREAFGVSGPEWEAENIRRLVTRVSPSLIRTEADEATYPAHVILRYELEKQLIGGDLSVADLPGAWNDGMRRLLGVTPDSDANGCMQDIHWPDGTFGYFPSYTLGAMMAAQFFDALKRAVPGVGDAVRQGDFAPLFDWLRTNVHAMGAKLSSQDLLRHATGQTLDAALYKRHLENRYLAG